MSSNRIGWLSAVVLALLGSAAPLATHAAARSDLVLVIGATGRSGPALLGALKAEGYSKVRAMVRNPATAKPKLGEGIEIVQGDVRDAASLALAMKDVKYIVSALGSNSFNDPTNRPELVDFEGVRNIAAAAKAAGVKQYVQVSSLGVTNPNHPLNRFGKVMEWKLKGENALRASGVPYTIVRPGGLGDGPGGLVGIKVMQGDKLDTGSIPRADVGTVCVKALGNRDAINRTFEIVSDAAGTKVDWKRFFKGLKADPRS